MISGRERRWKCGVNQGAQGLAFGARRRGPLQYLNRQLTLTSSFMVPICIAHDQWLSPGSKQSAGTRKLCCWRGGKDGVVGIVAATMRVYGQWVMRSVGAIYSRGRNGRTRAERVGWRCGIDRVAGWQIGSGRRRCSSWQRDYVWLEVEQGSFVENVSNVSQPLSHWLIAMGCARLAPVHGPMRSGSLGLECQVSTPF